MEKITLFISIIFIVLAVIIFLFADGLRMWYGGGFFLVMGVLVLINSIQRIRRKRL